MLRKLLKYEFKATARLFIPLYMLMLILTMVGRLLFSSVLETEFTMPLLDILFTLTMVAYFVLICSTLVMTVVIIIRRFYTNLLCQDGYLMHTLPVTTHQLILSKLIAAFVWQLLSNLVVVLSVFGIFFTTDVMANFPDFYESLTYGLDMLSREFGFSFALDSIIIFLSLFTSLAYSIILYYTSIAIGHMVKKHKVWASFGAYFAVSFVVQQVVSLTNQLAMGTPDFYSMDTMWLYDVYKSAIYTSFFMTIVLGIAGYFLTHYILKNKLNLS